MPKPSKNAAYRTPQLAALMAQIADSDDGKEEEKEVVVSHPPVSYDEFLEVEGITEWPQRLTSEGILDLSMIDMKTLTKETIDADLAKSAQNRMSDYEQRLTAFASFMTNPADDVSSRLADGLFHAPSQEYLDEAANAVAVKLHPSRRVRKKDMKQALQEEAQALKTRDISYVTFPGFRPKELTELPSQLEAPQLLNKVTEAQVYNKGFLPLWKKLFLSEASAAILQDAFWWIFLEVFESNPEAQDRIFTRMAGSYIALFTSVHPDIRDKFFAEYPRCLSQAVYLTFYEAFPESLDRFGEEFVTEMSSHIYQWIYGIKPPVGHWKSWPFDKIYPPPDVGRRSLTPFGHRRMSVISTKADFPSSDSMKFDINDVVQDSSITLPTEQTTSQIVFKVEDATGVNSVKNSLSSARTGQSVLKSSGKPSVAKTQQLEESAPAGPGPDMERVLFNLSGRSPLVAHYLYVKNLRRKETLGKLMKRTEVVREPPPGVTFNDVIQKSRKTVKRLHNQRKKNEEDTEAYIKKLHHQHRKALLRLKEVEKHLYDPMHLKVKSERLLEEADEKNFLRRVTKEVSKDSGEKASNVEERLVT